MTSLGLTSAAASTTRVLTSTETSVVQACEHPMLRGSPHLGAGATFRLALVNLGHYPVGHGASSDLGVFSRGRSLDACVAVFTHLRAEGGASLVAATTPRLRSTQPFSGLAGVMKGGYSANRDLDTLTVWVAGELAAGVTAITLQVAYSVPCKNDPTCPGPLYEAGRSAATISGRYFAAAMVVAYSAPRADFSAVLSWRTAKGASNVGIGVENFTTPLAGSLAPHGF